MKWSCLIIRRSELNVFVIKTCQGRSFATIFRACFVVATDLIRLSFLIDFVAGDWLPQRHDATSLLPLNEKVG